MNKLEWILFLVHPDRSHLVLRIEELFNRRRLFGARVCTPTHIRYASGAGIGFVFISSMTLISFQGGFLMAVLPNPKS
jgi:hypothetical protein